MVSIDYKMIRGQCCYSKYLFLRIQ